MRNKPKWYSAVLLGLVLLLASSVVGCAPTSAPAPAPISEPPIPAHFTTYTDEANLFSISYPPDWELLLSEIEGLEQFTKELIKSTELNDPIEAANIIFLAGVPRTDVTYDPNANIVVSPIPGSAWPHDSQVEVEMKFIKNTLEKYREFSRTKTTVDGRQATIIDYEGIPPGMGKGHFVQLHTFRSKTYWTVTCTTLHTEMYSDYRDDLHAIVRSLRILK